MTVSILTHHRQNGDFLTHHRKKGDYVVAIRLSSRKDLFTVQLVYGNTLKRKQPYKICPKK